MKYAQIIIPIALQGTYTYIVPDSFCNVAKPGSSVVVNFGKSKLYIGIVSHFTDKPETEIELKEILSCSDKPLADENQLGLWTWIAQYYCCSLGEVMKAALPSGLRPDSETRFIGNSGFLDVFSLPEKQQILFNALNSTKPIGIHDIINATGIRNPIPDLSRLAEQGVVQCGQFLSGAYKPLQQKLISLNFDTAEQAHKTLDTLKRSPNQTKLINFLIEQAGDDLGNYETELLPLMKKTGVDYQVIASLQKKSIIKIKLKEVSRFSKIETTTKPKELTPAQNICLEQIRTVFSEKNVCLLHGVTSSGKTEIYIHLIEEAIRNNLTALYLLPEIAITTQIVHRIKEVFGDIVGVYHSKYSDSERVEVWKNIHEGRLKIIIGVRSSVFLPFVNPGIVIVDEEHENTYKQYDPAPRYHARDVAIVMAKIYNSKVLLATATPSVETYYNTISGKYGMVCLTSRYGDIEMPKIVVANTIQARKRKAMQMHFHPLLIEEIKGALANHEQVILFQNRRGFSPYVECTECGWIPKCENCNVSLTFHKHRQQLLCHYCGYSTDVVKNCPECKSTAIKTIGFGTEMIESETEVFFPEARVARLDYDAAGTRNKYEKLISDFENRKIDILIGTQMISKGLDFDNVSVVGIMNADNMLNFPDFRAFERSFQLMSQVSGRAGRRLKRGKVIIQTSMPEHAILKYVKEGDYYRFAENELLERKAFRYPPYYKFINIKIKHKSNSVLRRAAGIFVNRLSEALPNRILGPHEPLVNKVQQWYLMQVIVRFENNLSAPKIKEYIQDQIHFIENQSDFKGIQISLDVDPM